MWVLTLLLGVVVILVLIALNGYFVAQEFAYMAVDRSRLMARSAQGDVAADRALQVTRRTSFMLSGAQLGITVTAILAGYVAEPLIGESLAQVFGLAGVPTAVGVAVGTVLALVLTTFTQMIFGELFPKNLAIARPEAVALSLARSTKIYLAVFGWLIWVFDQVSNLVLKVLGIEPVHDVEHSANVRDLEHIVADSRESGDLPEELSILLDRVLDFPQEDAEHAMIPRSQVDIVRVDDTVGEVRDRMASGHSRYPVLDAEDDIVGVIHLADVLGATDSEQLISEIAREATLVPTTMALPDALQDLVDTRNRMACVIDEWGGFVGILTLEDLAEEIVGEIADEYDPPTPQEIAPQAEGVWVLPGDIHLDEVERALGQDIPQGDYETLAGLVIDACGELPEEGRRVVVELEPDPADLVDSDLPLVRRIELEVLAVERHVPAEIRLTRLDPEPAVRAEAEGGEE